MSVMQYQWEGCLEQTATQTAWVPSVGPIVVQRDAGGKAHRVKFTVLVDNPSTTVYLVGPFNDWGKQKDGWRLEHDKHSVYASIVVPMRHKTPYKFLVDGTFRQDPAGHFFGENGNTLFWDFDDPSTYKQKYALQSDPQKSCRILQTDLPGLIAHWASHDGTMGKDVPVSSYYAFIADSGIIDHVRSLGYTAVQFLPFAQSIDGDNWKYRYLIPFQFAIQNRWGTPDDFARMIDMWHKAGIAVIGDFVISHFPYKDYFVFGFDGEDNGIQLWKNRHGTCLFMHEETPWGTKRIDYDNAFVRSFMIDSCLHFLHHYRIDGYRIDNVDGILRYGDNGDGDERPCGRLFLRTLTQQIYAHYPKALIHFESHYYHEDNAKMLVVPYSVSDRSLGATAYNGSRLTYYFHRDYMLKAGDKISTWKFRHIVDEQEWGQSNSTVADFHNHDAAAGLMDQRATGSYAYDAMTVNDPGNHVHAVGKIKVMEALISIMAEGRTLDLAQTFLLQTGTFEHDSSIQWFLTYNPISKALTDYKTAMNVLMDDPAFWPTGKRKFLNVDERNKILVIKRFSSTTQFVAVINLTSWSHHDYRVGLDCKDDMRLVHNSDAFHYGGFGMCGYPEIFENVPSKNFAVLEREIVIPVLAPYGILVFKA